MSDVIALMILCPVVGAAFFYLGLRLGYRDGRTAGIAAMLSTVADAQKDATAVVQAALDTGLVDRLPNGTYRVTDTVTVRTPGLI